MVIRLRDYTMRTVTFITSTGAMHIRLTDMLEDTIARAAKTLEARYVVAAFDWSDVENCPVWSVYDMHRAQRHGPGKELSFPLPVKQFINESDSPAVMYALALQGGSHGTR